ncbi:MAG: tRNA 2-thiouridine(34) synthase MnmA [Bacilli bacterium]|jgi:tRNA-specific 2-thiouridylase
MASKKTRVMIGLSGGVDSAVAAYLLKKEGYEVIGGFMRNWDAIANQDISGNPTLDEPICPQEVDYEDAKKVAEKLGIPLFRIDFVKEYWDEVFSYFLSEYEKGRTPNPDVFCNKYIKFAHFLTWAKEQNCDYIATGHYAKLVDEDGKKVLLKAFDKNKDQTYFLSQLSQEQLQQSIFPLGDIDKTEVRRIAHELDLEIADKKDSTGVCFIGERHFKDFLHNYLPMQKGEIIDINSNQVIGTHDGVFYYTIGQRRGLGIGGIAAIPDAKGWYVCKKDIKNNRLYVACNDSDEHLFSDSARISTLNWNNRIPKEKEMLNAKFRYRQKNHPVIIEKLSENECILTFPKPYKALTPGQACVFYDGEVCLGGGIIEEVFYKGKKIN